MSTIALSAAGAFFGNMGVAIALALASKPPLFFTMILYRPRRRIRHCQVRHRHRIDGCAQARHDHEVHRAHYHGRYSRYLRSHRGRHPPSEE